MLKSLDSVRALFCSKPVVPALCCAPCAPLLPSHGLEVGQISWQWRPFPFSSKCDTHSRVVLASRLVLAPSPLQRVTLKCNVTLSNWVMQLHFDFSYRFTTSSFGYIYINVLKSMKWKSIATAPECHGHVQLVAKRRREEETRGCFSLYNCF